MDSNRFDDVTRQFAAAGSRRRLLKGAAAGIAGTVAAALTQARSTVLAQGSAGDCDTVGERPFEVCAVLGERCLVDDTRGICCTSIHRCKGLLARVLRRIGLLGPCSACICFTGEGECPGF